MTSGQSPKPSTTGDSPEILSRVREGLHLVDIVARQMARRFGGAIELDELASMGREGLLSAARGFEPDRGVPFRRWANIRVRGAILDGVRSMGALPRRIYSEIRAMEAGDRVVEALHEEDAAAPSIDAAQADSRLNAYLSGIATAMAVGFLAEAPAGGGDEPRDRSASAEEQLARHELVEHVRASIARLPEAERRLLERHYFDGVDFDDASRELGLSKSWGSRLHARAIEAVVRDLRRSKVVR